MIDPTSDARMWKWKKDVVPGNPHGYWVFHFFFFFRVFSKPLVRARVTVTYHAFLRIEKDVEDVEEVENMNAGAGLRLPHRLPHKNDVEGNAQQRIPPKIGAAKPVTRRPFKARQGRPAFSTGSTLTHQLLPDQLHDDIGHRHVGVHVHMLTLQIFADAFRHVIRNDQRDGLTALARPVGGLAFGGAGVLGGATALLRGDGGACDFGANGLFDHFCDFLLFHAHSITDFRHVTQSHEQIFSNMPLGDVVTCDGIHKRQTKGGCCTIRTSCKHKR